VIGQASNGREALNEISALSKDLHPYINLTEIEMPSMKGIEIREQIAAKYPVVNMIIMTTFSRDV
ncbi:DNA-binding response regulator, partial [Pseudoalteromonas sp. S1610]|uniref:response regulator n=1 Tax=Pseudoalteromonas sp. S1610 TaxID=579506 RepID=UPI00110B292B